METERKQFNLFIRRWQARLFIAGLILPAIIFVTLGLVFRMEADTSVIAALIVGGSFLLVALILQGWRYER
ncbi:hypothetical protein [Luteolibacter rhizosphaerae]|jgi:hypothetical protein|nr:hypothetical protein [Luteolibacter rhizosphaerae]